MSQSCRIFFLHRHNIRDAEHLGLDDVDLPRLLAGAVNPDLVLQGVAAGVSFSSKAARPASSMRWVAAVTCSACSPSTPKWSIRVASPDSPSIRTSHFPQEATHKWPSVSPRQGPDAIPGCHRRGFRSGRPSALPCSRSGSPDSPGPGSPPSHDRVYSGGMLCSYRKTLWGS
jgi:hypothetical protein